MAALPAALTCSGVGKSGSPALKSTTLCPARRSRSASAATLSVADAATCASRCANIRFSLTLSLTPDPCSLTSPLLSPHPLLDGRRHQPAHFPAQLNTSLISRELRYVYCSAGIMNTVSSVGSRWRFISAIWNSYSKSDTARSPRTIALARRRRA